VTKEENLS